jgi:hypothetical protein
MANADSRGKNSRTLGGNVFPQKACVAENGGHKICCKVIAELEHVNNKYKISSGY